MGRINTRTRRWIGLGLAALAFNALAQSWQRLEDDGIHDPSNPALKLLQEPGEALAVLPPDTAGNKVDWIRALRQGHIQPRGSISGEEEEEILDLDLVMTGTGVGSVPFIRFPHKAHTEWLACSNCHDGLFEAEAGATEFTMRQILNGEFCGTCHGAVSFPLTECNRCHSIPPGSGDDYHRAKQEESP